MIITSLTPHPWALNACGVYATRSDAEAAAERCRRLPGFSLQPDGFSVDEYTLGKDHWTEGFATIVPINFRQEPTEKWHLLHALWLGSDRYEITEHQAQSPPPLPPNTIVSCKIGEVDGRSNLSAITQFDGRVIARIEG